MILADTNQEIKKIGSGWVLTIGNFDGLHVGHKEIIEIAKSMAREKGAKGVAVMTFDPHPVRILRPDHAPGVLTPIEIKKHLIEATGADCLVVITDSIKLLNLSPEQFVDEFLMETIQPIAVVEGSDFNFGYGRSGNVDTLALLGKTRGFDVINVELEKMNFSQGEYEKVSSTLIRHFLERGRVADARLALGREYRIVGQCVPGRKLGRKIGYPTANITPRHQIVPGEGVYAGMVQISTEKEQVCRMGKRYPAVFSIGRARTFMESGIPLLVESHVLCDDSGLVDNLYGKWLSMDFVAKIRNQQIFDSTEHLSEQIGMDCCKAKEILTDI